MYVFIILFLIFSCTSLKTHVKVNQHKAPEKLNIINDFKEGGENFVFIIRELQSNNEEDCKDMPVLCQPFLGSSASGTVLSYDKTSITVLTAAHFCVPSKEEALFDQKIIGFVSDSPRQLMILEMDIENDICILIGSKKKSDRLKNLKIAESFKIGEPVYTVAAPLGIAGPELRLVFEGRLAGCNPETCVSTIPATFGSSGAGIFNSKGELISIVMAVPDEFNHVTLSPSNKTLIKFIRDIDAEVDIYSY